MKRQHFDIEVPAVRAGSDTLLTHAGRHREGHSDFVNPAVTHASTVLHPTSADMLERYRADRAVDMDAPVSYGTFGSDLHRAFYEALMRLEGPRAAGAWALGSGLAACTIPLFAFLKAGDRALFPDCVYGPTREFAETVLTDAGVTIDFYSPFEGEAIEESIRPETKLIFIETPGSHSFEMTDVPAVVRAARRHDIVTVIDNTWATPLGMKPLDLGVDVVIHAATKYIAGHSDLTMGVVIANEKTWPALYRTLVRFGQHAAPDDVYLAYRGLHTLGARLKQQVASCRQIADWFAARPEVEAVLWPQREGAPGHDLWKRDMTTGASLFGVRFKPDFEAKLPAMIDRLKLFGRGYSWGGFESLLIPSYGTRTLVPSPFERQCRVAVGLEDPKDLIADLEAAFSVFD